MANERKPEEERLVKTFREICDEAKTRIRETTPEQVQALKRSCIMVTSCRGGDIAASSFS